MDIFHWQLPPGMADVSTHQVKVGNTQFAVMPDLRRGSMIEHFSFSTIIRAAVRGYRIVALVIAAMVLLAALYMHVAPIKYEASMVIAPTSASLADDTNIGASALGSGLVSSLIGGTGQMPKTFSEFASLTSSNFLAQALLADDKIKQGIYSKEWDSEKKQWKKPGGVVAALKAMVRTTLGLPVWQPPTPQDLSRYLESEIQITDIPRSDLYRVSYQNKNPAFATFFIGSIYKVLDQDLKSRFVRRHSANIAYIDQVLTKTSSPDLRTGLATLYMQEQRRMMLASSDLPFAADMVDPPTPSTSPVSPNAAIVYGAAIFLGIILGILAAVLWGDEAVQGRRN